MADLLTFMLFAYYFFFGVEPASVAEASKTTETIPTPKSDKYSLDEKGDLIEADMLCRVRKAIDKFVARDYGSYTLVLDNSYFDWKEYRKILTDSMLKDLLHEYNGPCNRFELVHEYDDSGLHIMLQRKENEPKKKPVFVVVHGPEEEEKKERFQEFWDSYLKEINRCKEEAAKSDGDLLPKWAKTKMDLLDLEDEYEEV